MRAPITGQAHAVSQAVLLELSQFSVEADTFDLGVAALATAAADSQAAGARSLACRRIAKSTPAAIPLCVLYVQRSRSRAPCGA